MKLLFSLMSQIKLSKQIKAFYKKIGKEKDSFLALKYMSKIPIIKSIITRGISPTFCAKRATSCICFHKTRSWKGSVTVEASLIVPIFLYAILCIIYLLEILATQMVIQTNMNAVYQKLSQEMHLISYVSGNRVEEELVELIGASRMEQSILVDGSSGLDCSSSYVSLVSGIITLQVDYKVRLPFPQFLNLGLTFSETLKGKG